MMIIFCGYILKISSENWTLFDEDHIGIDLYQLASLAVDNRNNVYASVDYSLSSLADMSRPNIIKYNGKKWTVHNPVDNTGESLGYVGNITADLNGNLWASVYGWDDVYLAVHNGQKWVHSGSALPINRSTEIAVDASNTIWIGTGDGIYLIEQ